MHDGFRITIDLNVAYLYIGNYVGVMSQAAGGGELKCMFSV